MQLRLSEGLLREALTTLRRCGDGKRECVCWLTGPLTEPGLIDAVLHPRHRASAGGHEVDDDWITAAWMSLARGQREVRVQVHTHPGEAYHSVTDDTYPAVQTAGFLSLVIPSFARGVEDLSRAHLAELTVSGGWKSVDPRERLVRRSPSRDYRDVQGLVWAWESSFGGWAAEGAGGDQRHSPWAPRSPASSP
jgi:hypothetical protein